MRKTCQHCKRKAVCRPRDLCWRCFYDPGIRMLYTKQVRSGVGPVHGDGCRASRQPACPTSALAGSLAKMRVMQERACRGESLFHPGDNQNTGGIDPFYGLSFRSRTMLCGLEDAG